MPYSTIPTPMVKTKKVTKSHTCVVESLKTPIHFVFNPESARQWLIRHVRQLSITEMKRRRRKLLKPNPHSTTCTMKSNTCHPLRTRILQLPSACTIVFWPWCGSKKYDVWLSQGVAAFSPQSHDRDNQPLYKLHGSVWFYYITNLKNTHNFLNLYQNMFLL